MAEYYPLISRAVAGLRDGTPEARRSIYDRARQALVTQLRSMQPPIAEEAIARETAALDEAVSRVEAEIGPSRAEPPQPAPTPPPPPPPTVAVDPEPKASEPSIRRPVTPAPPVPPRRPVLPPLAERPAVRPTIPPLRPSAARPAAPLVVPDPPVARPSPVSRDDRAAKAAEPAPPAAAPVPDVAPAPTVAPAPAAAPAPAVTSPPPVLPTAPVLKVSAAEPRIDPPSPALTDGLPPELDTIPAARIDDDIPRPAAPRGPVERERPNLRIWIVALAALAAVVAVAFTAWRLRDSPEEMARTAPVAKPAEPVAGKIIERADNGSSASTTAAAVPATEPSPASTPSGGDSSTAAPVAAPAATTPVPADPDIPIAYKAAILVDAPDEPQKVKTYVGTVVWRLENVNQGQNQMLGTGVHADIDIPDAKVQVSLEMRRNLEPQFPASHTIELKFTVAPDSAVGSIKQIDVLQARREDMPTGDPLSGVPVTITKNYFLVGLTRGDAESRNLDLLKTRAWFDIPMILDNGKAAKVTFEKGTAGDKIIGEALQAWASGGGTAN